MCVIICKPADKIISELDVKNAHRVNSDGFGYMYYDSEQDRIIAEKGVFTTADPILKMIAPLQDKEAILHFRIKTHGEISNAACHPFRVTDKEKHGMTIYVMHNGTIGGMVGKPNESDTQIFVNKYLHKLLKHNPHLIEEPEFKEVIEKVIGTHNRLCFMYGKGKVLRLNESQWDWHETMRCSNKNFVASRLYVDETEKWRRALGADGIDDHYCGPHNHKSYRKSKNAYTSGNQALLCGHPVAIGDTLLITHKQEEEWFSEGEITFINPFSILVRFKDRQSQPHVVAFFLISGESTYQEGGYQCLPMNRTVVDSEQTISGLTNPEVTDPIIEAKQPDLLQLSPPALQDDPAFKKKAMSEDNVTPPSATLPIEIDLVEANSFKVSARGVTVDSKARYGGCWIQRYDEVWNTDVTLLDIYNMSAQDRFEHFMKSPEEAFNIYQDLIEKIVFDNVDDGILEMEEGVVFEVQEETDKTEEEKADEEGARIDAMMLAAGMSH